MAMDKVSMGMIESLLPGARVLCLGVPDMPDKSDFRDYAAKHGAVFVDAWDAIQHKGWERVLDLNDSVVLDDEREFDLVINPGTLEHCFNIAQALENAWRAVALGGHLLSVAPVSMLNHGYWNINPIAIWDWCVYNGGQVVSEIFAIAGHPEAQPKIQAIPHSRSGRGQLPPETVGYYLMRKTKCAPLTRWPAQGIYRSPK